MFTPTPCSERATPCEHRPQNDEEFSLHVTPELPAMLTAARAILGSDDLAWDAVQETLLRLWRNGPTLPAPRSVLRRLTELSALHLARCLRRRGFHEDRASTGELCCAEDPLADVASAESRALLRAALASLTRCYREVFELYEFDGRDYQAIAEVLGVPIGTVRSRLARARRELRGRLEGFAASSASGSRGRGVDAE